MLDISIYYVSSDKEYAQALTDAIQAQNLQVNSTVLRLGTPLLSTVEKGFSQAKIGVLVVSHAFFKHLWPQFELEELGNMAGGFTRKGADPDTQLFIIWHEISPEEVADFAPSLMSAQGIPSNVDMDVIVKEICGGQSSTISIVQKAPYEQVAVKQSGFTQSSIASDNAQIRDMLVSQFSEGELRDLAFDLDLDYDSYSGSGTSSTARQMVSHLQRSGRIEELLEQVERRRPYAFR